jgi:hypothetical protein
MALCLTPALLHAQQNKKTEAAAGGLVSTTILVVAAPLTTVGGIISSTTGLFSSILGQLDGYIRDNAVALQQDLQIGGGHTADDLAQIFGVPDQHRAAFGLALRQRADQLVPLTRIEGRDMQRTTTFALIIIDAMRQDHRLAPHAPTP